MSRASERSERITALEFIKRTEEDPSWAKNLDHPVIVYQYVDMSDSNIEYLSRWLRFSGKDDYGESASFIRCHNLQNAEGTYDGSVDFSRSGISKIGRLKVLGVDRLCWSAYFHKCPKLTKLSGEYYGPVAAADTNIKEIRNLRISKQNREKQKLDLSCTECSKIDEYSSKHIEINQILWDEHIDDVYIKKLTECLENHKNPQIQEQKKTQETVNKYLESLKPPQMRPQSKGSLPIKSNTSASIINESKLTLVKTLAEAIGADDLLVQQQVPLVSKKRRGLLKVSSLLTALIALFLYKTTDELTKQVIIDPTVKAIRSTPELVVNWADPKEKVNSQTIWPNEFSPALERYAKSSKTEEDKLALAKETILVMGLKPEALLLSSEESVSRSLEINNLPTPVSARLSHSLGGNIATEAASYLRLQSNAELASTVYQSLSAFEDMSETFKKSEVTITKREKEDKRYEGIKGAEGAEKRNPVNKESNLLSAAVAPNHQANNRPTAPISNSPNSPNSPNSLPPLTPLAAPTSINADAGRNENKKSGKKSMIVPVAIGIN